MIHRPLSCGGNPGASRTPRRASKACAGSGDAAAPREFRGSCLGQYGPWESAFSAVPNSCPIYVEERLRTVKVIYGLLYQGVTLFAGVHESACYPFHGENRCSIPLGRAKEISSM